MSVSDPTYYLPLVYSEWRRGERGPRGVWTSYWEKVVAGDPALRSLRMTIDLVFGGDRHVRIATEPMTTRSGDTGRVYHYLPALQAEPEVVAEYSLGSATSSLRALSLTVDGRLVEALALLRERRILAGWAEVSLQIDGGDYDQRIVVMRGDMSGGISFGAREELVEIEIVDPETTQDRQIPPYVASATTTVSGLPDETVGLRYPIVWNGHPAVPCLRLSTDASSISWLACSGSTHEVVGVRVGHYDYPASSSIYPWSSEQDTDLANRPFTSVAFGAGTGTFEDGATVYATLARKDGRTLSVIDVIRDLLVSWSLVGPRGISEDLFAAAETKLPPLVSVQVYANASGSTDTARAVQFVESTLAADLPMLAFVWSGDGYGPVVTDRRRGRIAASLRRGQYPVIDRASAISETAKTNLLNAFTLRYAYDAVEDTFAKVVVRDAGSSILCRISQEAVGLREADVMDAITIFDDATANYVVDWLVEHRSLPSYAVEYECFPVVAFTLRLGDNVHITDDRLGWVDEVATVERIVYSRGRAVLSLRVYLLYRGLSGGASSGSGVTGGGGGGSVGNVSVAATGGNN
jgi:hypothetical protein